MNIIGKNIRKIRAVKSLSQAAFAELFSIGRANIGAYEEGRATPKIELILEITKFFSINIEPFLTKELTVNEISSFSLDKKVDKGSGKKVESKVNKKELEASILRIEQELSELRKKIESL